MKTTVLPSRQTSASSLSDNLQMFSQLWEDKSPVLRAIIEESEDAIFAKDKEGRYLVINSAGARAIGKPIDQIVGRTDVEVFTKTLGEKIQADDLIVINSGQTHHFENILTTGSSTRIFHSIKSPYRNGEGEITGTIAISRDITDLKRAETSHQMLAKIGEVLSTSLNYKVRLTKLAELAVPQLADWCSVDVLKEDNTVQRVAVAHVDPSKVKLAQELQRRYPPDWDEPGGAAGVLRTGRPKLYPEFTDEMLVAEAWDEEHLQMLRSLNMRSGMMVPLTAREKTFGVMTFIWAESNRFYDEADLNLVEEIARRAAIAVDNARLYKAERDARRTAEVTAKRISSMQKITAAFSEAKSPLEVAKVVVEQGLDVMQANSGVVSLLDEQGGCLEVLHFFGYEPEMIRQWQRYSVSTNVPIAETVRTGEPIFLASLDSMTEHYPEWAEKHIPNHNSVAALPLAVEGRVIGSIGLSFAEAHVFSDKTRQFLMGIARQCAQALERARLYQAEKEARAEAEAAHQHLTLMTEIKERNRLAQELHDTVAQALGYLNLKMSMALMLLDQGQVEEIRESLQELKQITGETYTDVREEIFNLRSTAVPGVHFLDTLQDYIAKYKRFYNLDVHLVRNGDPSIFQFPDEVGVQLIRTIQEALINIRKHAQVDEAVIRLDQNCEGVYIQIEDRGRGFNPATMNRLNESRFGLQIMQERIEKVGGTLQIDSTLDQGTHITLFYPTDQN